MTQKDEQSEVVEPVRAGETAEELDGAVQQQLKALARDHAGTPTGDLLGDVLAGRKPLGTLLEDQALAPRLRSGISSYREYMQSLNPLERQELTRQVAALLASKGR